MTIKEWRLIEARVKEELANISYLLGELERQNIIAKDNGSCSQIFPEDDRFMLRAIGSVLHDFYVAVENIFEIIGRELDEHIPEGLDWHIQLLRQMTLEVKEVRMAVISRSVSLRLDRYRAFRHVFRNVYGFNLDAARIEGLVDDLANTARQFKQEIEGFLDGISRVME